MLLYHILDIRDLQIRVNVFTLNFANFAKNALKELAITIVLMHNLYR